MIMGLNAHQQTWSAFDYCDDFDQDAVMKILMILVVITSIGGSAILVEIIW